MQKLVAITLALATLGFAAPVASAETVTEPYNGALGVAIEGVIGFAVVVCPTGTTGCDFDGNGENDIDPIGGVRLYASQTYTNVVVAANDEGLWGSDAGVSTCFWNPAGDNTCNTDDYGSSAACGGVALTGSPFAANFVTVWVYTLIVMEDTTVCGGTFGTIAGDFF